MPPTILPALPTQAPIVSSILTEAADWLASRGQPLWRPEQTSLPAITPDVLAGLYYIAWLDNQPAAVVRLQLQDPDFWPDAAQGEALYLHRLAVRRPHAGGKISTPLLHWIVRHAHELNRQYLRLDCAADRPSLRHIYERFGFQFHSERNVGPFTFARYQLQTPPQNLTIENSNK